MCKGFHSLQRDGQMVDVTIAAGGKIFKAHKLVLSVCSPYFQKIFLEHPSQHPILFMTDVNSHHMAGLLDFMYSGQVGEGRSNPDSRDPATDQCVSLTNVLVNVKYEDLPNFLKVAEALQVKGLHGEELMKAKHAAAAVVLNEDYLNNNNSAAANNNNNNGNLSSNGGANGPLSPYASKKMLDSQKYQKYYSKRKLVQQYEQEMRAEKRKLGIEDVIQAAAAANALNLRLNNGGSPIGSPSAAAAAAAAAAALNPPGTPTNGGTSTDDEQQHQQHQQQQQQPVLLQNIKSEPHYDDEDEGMEVDQDNNNTLSAANANNNNNNNEDDYYGQHDQGVITTGNGKTIKHSILEPNIVLKQSDECLTTSNQTGSLNLCKNVS
ncbi:ORF-A short, putative [Anopheles sinensis]|uniref:BTB domain-containing protein n=1 Tax=Anopheles sinensis TaxID=74873 RepID=A0A084VEI4_ANOSI|nr:ORF-A short, putative [Anopheles sinensis]